MRSLNKNKKGLQLIPVERNNNNRARSPRQQLELMMMIRVKQKEKEKTRRQQQQLYKHCTNRQTGTSEVSSAPVLNDRKS